MNVSHSCVRKIYRFVAKYTLHRKVKIVQPLGTIPQQFQLRISLHSARKKSPSCPCLHFQEESFPPKGVGLLLNPGSAHGSFQDFTQTDRSTLLSNSSETFDHYSSCNKQILSDQQKKILVFTFTRQQIFKRQLKELVRFFHSLKSPRIQDLAGHHTVIGKSFHQYCAFQLLRLQLLSFENLTKTESDSFVSKFRSISTAGFDEVFQRHQNTQCCLFFSQTFAHDALHLFDVDSPPHKSPLRPRWTCCLR